MVLGSFGEKCRLPLGTERSYTSGSHKTCAGSDCQTQSLDLDVIPQLQLPGLRFQTHLLVPSLRHRIAVVAIPSYKTGHKRQKLPGPTTRILI